MGRFTILVDAGYLLTQAVKILSAKVSHSRAELDLHDPSGLIAMLTGKAREVLENERLLRVYWYDGVANGLSHEHRRLIDVDDLQFRAGKINGSGQQKGVDSMIVTDLIELASHHAISDALVITGDSDLAIGIELAQRRGVRVAAMGVEDLTSDSPVLHGQSFEITSLSDRLVRIGRSELDPYLRYTPRQQQASTSQTGSATQPRLAPAAESHQLPATSTSLESIVANFIVDRSTTLTVDVIQDSGRIATDVDRDLLHYVFTQLAHGRLSQEERHEVREHFRRQLHTTMV